MWLAILGAWVAFSFVFFATMMFGTWLADRNQTEVDDALF